MSIFNSNFTKEIDMAYKDADSTFSVKITFDKNNNILTVYKLGFNCSEHIVNTAHKEHQCPICKDTYNQKGTSGWDCWGDYCALGFINKNARLDTWQDRYSVQKFKEIIEEYYKYNKSEIVQKCQTLIERQIENIDYEKTMKEEAKNLMSELDKRYNTTDIHSEYHWSNYGYQDYTLTETVNRLGTTQKYIHNSLE